MSQPMETKYEKCVICGEEIVCYGHTDERYCSEHQEEYEKLCSFMERYKENDWL